MTIATIDARGAVLSNDNSAVTTMTSFAGLPLLARLVRTAGRLGVDEVQIAVGGAEERSAAERCIERYPGPEGTAVQFVTEPVAGDIQLDPRGLYLVKDAKAAIASGDAPEPAIITRERADIRAAVGILDASVKKPLQSDGVVSFYVIRPLVNPLQRLLLPTPLTPNHVSLIAMASGIAAAILAGIGGVQNFLFAGILFWVTLVLDHVDGQIARLKLVGSRLGEWLDAVTDDVTTFGLMAGVGIGMNRMGYDPVWMYLLVGGAILGSLVHSKMLYDLHKLGGAIDIADYPWFFGTPSEAPSKPRGLFGAATMVLNYLVRRDVFCTALSVALVVFQPVALALILTFRGLTAVPMLLVNEVIKLVRGNS